MAARALLELDGYEPDEMKSLLKKLLRNAAYVREETRRFYWWDRVKILATKNPRVLVESLLEDHAAVPNSVINHVVQFVEQGKWNRDQYVAVQVMESIGSVKVDRNLSRLKELSLRDYAMGTIENKIDWDNRQQTEIEKEAIALEDIRKFSRKPTVL